MRRHPRDQGVPNGPLPKVLRRDPVGLLLHLRQDVQLRHPDAHPQHRHARRLPGVPQAHRGAAAGSAPGLGPEEAAAEDDPEGEPARWEGRVETAYLVDRDPGDTSGIKIDHSTYPQSVQFEDMALDLLNAIRDENVAIRVLTLVPWTLPKSGGSERVLLWGDSALESASADYGILSVPCRRVVSHRHVVPASSSSFLRPCDASSAAVLRLLRSPWTTVVCAATSTV